MKMGALGGRVRRRLFGIPVEETTLARRGFRTTDPATQERLEHVGRVFLVGYHAALDTDHVADLARHIDASVETESRGWAFEGAAMALALLDRMTPWKRDRVATLLAGPGDAHAYMVHVGVGWAIARLKRPVGRSLRRLDPLLGWLAVDGYGFHEGYFHWERCRNAAPRLAGYASRAFDQGLGRSAWFATGADADALARTIEGFAAPRRADLWSGVGLACSYAGGADDDTLDRLARAAGRCRPDMAQGAAFAAKARERAGIPAAHTDHACRIVCGISAERAAEVTDEALAALGDVLEVPGGADTPAYEQWRQRIRAAFASTPVAEEAA